MRHEDFEKRARVVFDNFAERGFSEAASTEYLIVFGPNNLKNGGGDWCAMWFTQATLDHPIWM